MNEDQLSMYSAYMSTLGNREDLFPGSGYVDKYIENPPDDYTVNAAYLTDEKFATLIARQKNISATRMSGAAQIHPLPLTVRDLSAMFSQTVDLSTPGGWVRRGFTMSVRLFPALM
jgi:hypothetical protein